MKPDDNSEENNGSDIFEESENGSSGFWDNVIAAGILSGITLLIAWIFPYRRGRDWWTLDSWEIIGVIGLFVVALYILSRKD